MVVTNHTTTWPQHACVVWVMAFAQDVAPSAQLAVKRDEVLTRGNAAANTAIAQFKAGTLPLQPGCNEDQSLEATLNRTLSGLREWSAGGGGARLSSSMAAIQ